MWNSRLNKFYLFLGCLFLALAAGMTMLYVSPFLTEKNPLFLVAVPIAALVALVMFMDAKFMMLLLLYTRALMDPFFNMTKVGEGAAGTGIGAVLNVLVVILVIVLIFRFPQTIKSHRAFIRAWLIFLAICLLSAFFSPDRIKSLKLLVSFVTYACIALVPFILVQKPEDKKFWVKQLLFSSFLPVALAIAGVASHHPFFYGQGRLKGTFTHANILAFYLVLVIAVCFYIIKSGQFRLSLAKKLCLGVYLIALLAVLIITETRSAWIACAGLFFLYFLLKDRKYLLVLVVLIPLIFTIPHLRFG